MPKLRFAVSDADPEITGVEVVGWVLDGGCVLLVLVVVWVVVAFSGFVVAPLQQENDEIHGSVPDCV